MKEEEEQEEEARKYKNTAGVSILPNCAVIMVQKDDKPLYINMPCKVHSNI